MQAKVKRIFLNADLRASHFGLSALSIQHRVPVRLEAGEMIVFVNTKRTLSKILCSNNVLLHLKPHLEGNTIDLRIFQYLPEIFAEKKDLKVSFDTAMAVVLKKNAKSETMQYTKAFERPPKKGTPIDLIIRKKKQTKETEVRDGK